MPTFLTAAIQVVSRDIFVVARCNRFSFNAEYWDYSALKLTRLHHHCESLLQSVTGDRTPCRSLRNPWCLRRPVEWLQNDWKLSHHGIRTENLLHKAPLCPNRSLPFCTQSGLLETHGFIESDRFVTPQCDHSGDLIDQPRWFRGWSQVATDPSRTSCSWFGSVSSSKAAVFPHVTSEPPFSLASNARCRHAHNLTHTPELLPLGCAWAASLSWQQEFSWAMG
jgi:hypothetical protein